MRSLDRLHLSPSVSDMRSWSLSSSGLFAMIGGKASNSGKKKTKQGTL